MFIWKIKPIIISIKAGLLMAGVSVLATSAMGVSVVAAELNPIEDVSVVNDEDMTPERIAQRKAVEEAERKRLEYEAEAARTAQALEQAQLNAQAKEASDTYATWGTYGNYDSPEVILSKNSATISQSAGAQDAVAPVGVAPVAPLQGVMTVDVVIFAGQSNMSGAGGNAKNAPAVAAGQGYEFKAVSSPNGLYPIKEPFGNTEGGYVGENSSLKRGSLVSSFVNAYYAQTGVPVVAISAARGNTASSWWAQPQVIADLNSRFTKALNYLNTNHYSVRRKYVVFLQGESDVINGVKQDQYKRNINSAFSGLFNAGLDQVFIITPGCTSNGIIDYSPVVKAQEELCASNSRFSLGSELLRTLPASYMSDELHYNQKALNMVGADAAARVAAYSNSVGR